jgi:hypothetical protein
MPDDKLVLFEVEPHEKRLVPVGDPRIDSLASGGEACRQASGVKVKSEGKEKEANHECYAAES